MGRRKTKETGLLELALNSDWPVAAVIAAGIAFFGVVVLPASIGENPYLSQALPAIRVFIWAAAGVFALIAIIKYAAKKARSSLLKRKPNARHEPTRQPPSPKPPQPAPVRSAPYAPSTITSEPDSGDSSESEHDAKPNVWSRELLQRIEWKRFEDLCAAFYREKGIRCTTTPLGPDGGIDIRLMQDAADPNATTAVVQCKAWGERLVGVKPVRELLGVMTHEKVAKAFFMTSGGFTDEARVVAKANRITLIDGKLFLAMIERLPQTSRERLLTFATEGDYATPTCPRCGVKMVAREGARGRFWGCLAYPKCRHTLQMRGAS